MYFQKDYVLRVIEQFGFFFRRLKEKLELTEQLKDLGAFSREKIGMTPEAALALKDETLNGLLDARALFLLTEVLFILARLTEGKDPDRAGEIDLRTLRLLSSLHGEDELAAVRSGRLRELACRLRDAMSPDDFLACARFFLNGGYYADTEDMVFLAAQTSDKAHRDYYVQQGLALLYNMRVLPDDVLLPGGMSRQDIGESIADLRKMNLE